MSANTVVSWPSGDCTPIIATLIEPEALISSLGVQVFRDRDDVDWFVGARFDCDGVGPVLIMRHVSSPEELTAIYVDAGVDIHRAEETVRRALTLDNSDIYWRRSSSV